MSNLSIANQIVTMCREGRGLDAINELYSNDIVSVESAAPPDGGDRETKGKEGVLAKNKWFSENFEIHEATVEGPWPHGSDKFAVHFRYDVTNKPMKKRQKMDEIGVYTVANDKVIREEFFYTMEA